MKPTNEQIIEEARRRAKEQNWRMDIEDYIIEVMREGLAPPEPGVDPDVLAYREWFKTNAPTRNHDSIDAGEWDHSSYANAYLAGARMAAERERERAKVLVDYVEIDADHHHVLASGRARNVLAKYRGEA